MTFFTELEQGILTFVCNPKTQNCQSNPEEKEQIRRHKSSRLQTTLQNYRNQDSVVLAVHSIDLFKSIPCWEN